ncbi:MAG: IgGFc-binding protein [Kofleriaceae bacterium]
MASACGSSRPNGGDDDTTCTEGDLRCNGTSTETCTGGMWVPAVNCPGGCVDGVGCTPCQPGVNTCANGDVVGCDDTGNPTGVVQTCDGNLTCEAGTCVDACADAAMAKSYIGCEYWAVDLDNALEVEDLASNTSPFGCSTFYTGSVQKTMMVCSNGSATAGSCDPGATPCPSGYTCQSAAVCVLDAEHSPFAIVVSNPNTEAVNVTITSSGGQMITQSVAAGAVAAIKPQANNAIPDLSMDGSEQIKNAYQITSNLPIVAYQFNPLDNVNVFSNDASLLIPRTSFDVDYYALSWPTLDRRSGTPSAQNYNGYIAIVASDDDTEITVTTTTGTQVGAMLASIAANTPTNFTLNKYDVLELEAQSGDLSGSHIVATNGKTFGMFGGHEAAVFGETGSECCADHLEEMLFPSSTWGKNFAIARSQKRTSEPDYLRIMAQTAGTAVTFTPAPSATVSGNCANLGPGQFCDVKIQGDTEIASNNPILVGHYIESTITGTGGTGDPSMAIAVPVEQFRSTYTVLVPQAYDKNYFSIAASGQVLVDGQPITTAAFPGGGTHQGARVTVNPGQHTINCQDTCSVLVYGYSDAVSYMFAGGLDLKQIVIE